MSKYEQIIDEIVKHKRFKEIDRAIHIGDSNVGKIETSELDEPIICADNKEDMESLKKVFENGI